MSTNKMDSSSGIGSANKVIQDIKVHLDILLEALRQRQAQLIEEVNTLCDERGKETKSEKLQSQMDNIPLQIHTS
jgi:hypothetical protein